MSAAVTYRDDRSVAKETSFACCPDLTGRLHKMAFGGPRALGTHF